MKLNQDEAKATLSRLINNPATRAWERKLLRAAAEEATQPTEFTRAINKLEAALRPLAIRNNLTPDVTDFYSLITGKPEQAVRFDLSRHYATDSPNVERAIFAGGCFWCMVEPFETRPGILSVVSGYTGGNYANPTYEQVSGHYTGHVEAVEIIFDRTIITYEQLVAIYWKLIDPTDNLGQVNDRGEQYRPIIFVNNNRQREIAAKSKQQIIASKRYKKPIIVEIKPQTEFWPAENFHQDFYRKNPQRYQRIERARQQYLKWQNVHGWVRTKLLRIEK